MCLWGLRFRLLVSSLNKGNQAVTEIHDQAQEMFIPYPADC